MTNNIYQKNNLVSYIIFLGVLFILIFFTKDLAFGLYEKWQNKNALEITQAETRKSWENYDTLKKQLESGAAENNSDLQKYAKAFSQAEFIEFLYDYIENGATGGTSTVKTIRFEEPFENELGFMQVDINMSVKVSSLATMGQMLRYLVSEESEYKIFITDFSFPNDSGNTAGFVVDVPMKVFYK